MPGILGFVTKNPRAEDADVRLSTMLDAMRHEPFYTHGVYHAPDLGCHVGWVNHKDSFSDCNPIVNANRDVILIFSGEHFAHGSHRQGESSRSSARELLRLYEEKGSAFLLDLNGWFAGVLIDLRQKRVVVFNDRFGMHRVYYTEDRDSFVFASEAKSVLAVSPACRELDPAALGQFLSYGSVFQGHTLFSNVSLLPGGASWSLDKSGDVKKERYFDPATWEQQSQLSADVFYEALKDSIVRIMPEYYRANTGAAVSLTGGLDTRIIMAGRPAMKERTPCYTYGGVYRDCYDVRTAAEIAAASGQSHQVIPLGREFFDNFGSYAERSVWLTDGYLDIAGAHELYYSQQARVIAPVRVTGNYGSEVLRSHSTFRGSVPSGDTFADWVIPHCQDAVNAFTQIKAGHEVSFSAMQEVPFHLYGKLAVAQSQLEVRSPYMDNDLVSLVYQAPPDVRKTRAFSLRLIADLNPALAGIETDMGFSPMGSQLLAQPRRMHRYATFKAEWYYNLGMPQWLSPFDGPLLKVFEPLFLGKHKIEHYRLWFRDDLAEYIQTMLSGAAIATRPYVKSGAVQALRATRRINGQYVSDVNKLITLELIHKLFLDSAPPPRRTLEPTGSLAVS